MTDPDARIAIAGVSHHTADVMALEAFRFGDEPGFLEAAGRRFRGVLLLQTCNRVEIMVEGDAGALRDFLAGQGKSGFFLLEGRDALRHLLSLAPGIESMIVGEDQIIGQLKKALADAESPAPPAVSWNSASTRPSTWASGCAGTPKSTGAPSRSGLPRCSLPRQNSGRSKAGTSLWSGAARWAFSLPRRSPQSS